MTGSKWDHRPDQLAPFRAGGYELIPLNAVEARDQRGRLIGKAPMGSKWRLLPALSVDEAKEHMHSGHNVGVRLRPTDLVIDADPRNYPEGDDPLARLGRDLGIDWDDYPRVVTGSGGYHIYMTKPADALLRDTLEAYPGVEFKTHGRQVVAPGSVHPGDDKTGLKAGGRYHWYEDPLAPTIADVRPAPDALIELARRPGRVAAVDAGRRSPEELERMLDGLDPTQFREHSAWFELMCACHHATGGEGRDEFIAWSTGDPEFSGEGWVIGRRWDTLHADTSGRRVTEKTLFKALVDQGRADLLPRDSAADDFADVEEVQRGGDGDDDIILQSDDETGDPTISALERMNAKGYCAVNENGVFRIYRQRKDWNMVTPDTPAPREYWETSRKGDFMDFLSNQRVQKGERTVSIADEWLKWGGRTTYDGVVFDPGNRVPRSAKMLNLWTDWAVEPKQGDWSLLDQLLLEGLCDGNREFYEYVLDWSAFMIQHPDQQAEVALVFKGQKGTGKGTFLRALYKLAGRHGLHISSQQHFTNHFNAHLRDCLAGDTMVLTREHGAVRIDEVAGKTVTLLDGNGEWVRCPIVDHGVQQTYETTFRSGRGRTCVTVRSTANHGWMVGGEKRMTRELDRGDVVDALSPAKTVRDEEAHRRGVVHGLVYGDGSSRGKADVGAFQLDVFSHVESLEPWLAGFHRTPIRYKTKISEGTGWSYRIPRAYTEGRDLKALPLCVESDDYLLGFIRGWFAADGCMARDGGSYLACGSSEAEWLRQWGPVVGWRFLGASRQPDTTNLGRRNKELFLLKVEKRSVVEGDLLIEQHRLNWAQDRASRAAPAHHGWKVAGHAPGRLERVYCPSVPTTGSFALASGIHSSNCILLFADEAMWAGDKRAESTLKALITEPTLIIEGKGKDVVTARNYLHVVMASNEDWVIPASMDDERRFAVSEVNTKFRGNKAFFAALYEQLEQGGLAGLLFDLKRRKLAGFHPRARIPQTTALAKQKLQSLDNLDAWWYESLCRGNMGDVDPVLGEWDSRDGTGSCVFFTEDLQRSLEDYLRKLGDRHLARRSTQTVIGDRLKKRLGSGVKHVRLAVPPDRMDIKADSSGRAYGYRVPSLQECRAAFENQLGSKLPWTVDAEDIDPMLDVEEI